MAAPPVWRITDAIVNDRYELVRWLDALRAWVAGMGGGGSPSNPVKSVQYNNAGAFGGDANFLWDSGTATIQLTGNILFAGLGESIQANTSDAAQVNRFWFSNSIANANTNWGIKPNGTATSAVMRALGKSDPSAAQQMLQVGQAGSISIWDYTVLNAGAQGTGEIRFGGATAAQFDETGNAQFKKGLQRPVVVKNANYTIVETDDVIFADASAGSITLTLPAANIAGAGFTPTYKIKRSDNVGANTVTIARAGADTIDGAATFVLGALQACELQSDGATGWGVF